MKFILKCHPPWALAALLWRLPISKSESGVWAWDLDKTKWNWKFKLSLILLPLCLLQHFHKGLTVLVPSLIATTISGLSMTTLYYNLLVSINYFVLNRFVSFKNQCSKQHAFIAKLVLLQTFNCLARHSTNEGLQTHKTSVDAILDTADFISHLYLYLITFIDPSIDHQLQQRYISSKELEDCEGMKGTCELNLTQNDEWSCLTKLKISFQCISGKTIVKDLYWHCCL